MSIDRVHPSAVGRDTQPERKGSSTREDDSCVDDPNMPPQRHAGAAGLGPNYVFDVGFGEKMAGLKEEIKGKILGEPEAAAHGRERRTGELKRREEARDNVVPSFTAGGDSEIAHTTPEKGAEEDAASAPPKGMDEAQKERRGERFGGNVEIRVSRRRS